MRLPFLYLIRTPQGAGMPVEGRPSKHSALELTQVSTNHGGTISGKFKINTTAFEEEKH